MSQTNMGLIKTKQERASYSLADLASTRINFLGCLNLYMFTLTKIERKYI